MSKISIIVPVYNVELYLRRCIDSILNQTFTDFELILVDDGSPDSSGKICDEYAESDERIKVIHKKNSGPASARNTGLDVANGEWITFVDSDDWINKEYLEKLYNSCKNNGVDISTCGFFQTEGNEIEIERQKFNIKLYNPEDLWIENQLRATVPWGKLYKKDLWSKIRFPVGKFAEDEYTIYKVLFQCKKIAHSEAELYYYFVNLNSITKSEWSLKWLDAVEAIGQQLKYFKKHKFERAEELTIRVYENVIDRNCKQTENKYIKENKKLKKLKRRLYINYKSEIKKRDGWEYLYKEYFPLEIKVRSYYIEAIKRIKRIIKK